MRAIFRNRDFRWLFAGRVVTNIGDSLYFIAAMWLVYNITGDAFYSGLAGFLTLLPSTLQFLTGPLVDRWDIRRTLVGTQVIQAVVITAIPVADWYGVLTVELVLVVMPTLALINQIVYPAQSAALPRLLDDEELVSANSAFAIAYQGIDMVANGIAGVFIGLVGAISLFVFDAVTFGLAALMFAMVTVPTANVSGAEDDASGSDVASTDGGVADDDPDSYLEELRGGLGFLRGTFLMWLILGVTVVNFILGFALATMPAYADTIDIPSMLGVVGAAGAYGILMGGYAGGNFLGAIGANAVDGYPLGRIMIVGFTFAGLSATAAIAVHWLPITALLIVLAFVPVGVVNVQLSAVVQSAPPEEFVGRISSVLGSASSVATPFGALAGGAAASAFGPRIPMFGLGAGLFLLATYVILMPGLRGLSRVDQLELQV
ncbi:MFS transporter [Halobacteriales archaeon QS_1_68_20]|nr:MAG: MFS transporter [Halobacteriales archaeon QS_1_68_20]